MPDIRTLTQLQDILDKEMGWRLKEIGTFRVASKRAGVEQKSFTRAGVALLYAHWEGFVKAASEHYLNFVDSRGHTYRELKSCFAIFGLKSKLQLLSTSRKATPNIDAFDFILSEMERPARMRLSSAIDTESNLTSKVFANIATSLDINPTPYTSKFNLIDESLVNRRNKVAHGEYIDLSGEQFGDLVDEVLTLMRNYKTDLQNAASLMTYRRQAPVAPRQAV